MQANKKPAEGETFMIKPLSLEVKRSRPQWESGGTMKYNFIITAELKDGTTAQFEYACPTQNPERFFHFPTSEQPAVYQWVKCTKPSEFFCNIQPCDPPGEERTSPLAEARKMVDDAMKTHPPKLYIDPDFANKNKPADIRGSAYTFIYAWAKDLVVAEMNSGKPLPLIANETEVLRLDTISRISYYAERIYGDMMKKIQSS